MGDAYGVTLRGIGTMNADKRNGYRASERCPVCGGRQSGCAVGTGPGTLAVMRAFYICGYTVTAAGTPSGRVLVVGIGCRGKKTVHEWRSAEVRK
jgi:hypothetical protein